MSNLEFSFTDKDGGVYAKEELPTEELALQKAKVFANESGMRIFVCRIIGYADPD